MLHVSLRHQFFSIINTWCKYQKRKHGQQLQTKIKKNCLSCERASISQNFQKWRNTCFVTAIAVYCYLMSCMIIRFDITIYSFISTSHFVNPELLLLTVIEVTHLLKIDWYAPILYSLFFFFVFMSMEDNRVRKFEIWWFCCLNYKCRNIHILSILNLHWIQIWSLLHLCFTKWILHEYSKIIKDHDHSVRTQFKNKKTNIRTNIKRKHWIWRVKNICPVNVNT